MRLLSVLTLALLLSSCATTAQDDAWTTLFNGRDLSGWMGDTDGYGVENGVIYAKQESGGNLYVDQPYDDFVMQFKFKLEPGGNNGVGIRAEQGKDAAYYGMEIQILDDYSETWADLQPWQYHGSIYGVAAAEKGALKPAGEWNEEEIRADGSHITVRLNGEVILDEDIMEVAGSGTIDEKEHPGLFNESGYIGFLGHGHHVEFKDIRIREL